MDYPTFFNNIKKTPNSINKLDLSYNHGDCRCWSAVINPESQNVIVTYVINRYEIGFQCFDILASGHILTDVPVEDIYDVIDVVTHNRPVLLESE